MRPVKIALVRHFHAASNEVTPESVVGNTDAALTERGREQAETTARILGSLVVVKEIVCSELLRARQSAHAVARVLGVPKERITPDPRFNEIKKGDWEGQAVEKVMEYEAEIEEHERYRHRPPGGGENLPILARRIVPAIIEKVNEAEETGQDVLIVSHDHPIRAGVGYLLDRPASTWENLEVENGSIVLLSKHEGRRNYRYEGTY